METGWSLPCTTRTITTFVARLQILIIPTIYSKRAHGPQTHISSAQCRLTFRRDASIWINASMISTPSPVQYMPWNGCSNFDIVFILIASKLRVADSFFARTVSTSCTYSGLIGDNLDRRSCRFFRFLRTNPALVLCLTIFDRL